MEMPSCVRLYITRVAKVGAGQVEDTGEETSFEIAEFQKIFPLILASSWMLVRIMTLFLKLQL